MQIAVVLLSASIILQVWRTTKIPIVVPRWTHAYARALQLELILLGSINIWLRIDFMACIRTIVSMVRARHRIRLLLSRLQLVLIHVPLLLLWIVKIVLFDVVEKAKEAGGELAI